jgi:hypothetical protein
MNLQEMEKRLQIVEDVQQIDKLENIYGYYLDNGQNEKIVKLFSDNPESIEISDRGVFKGKEGVRKFFLGYISHGQKNGDLQEIPHGRMVIHQQHQGVIDVAPDGRTAKGRWYLVMIQAWPVDGKPRSVLGHGVYENEFVKEDGVWKFRKMFMSLDFRSPIGEGWVDIPVVSPGRSPISDAPPTAYHPYPDMKLVPFHWEDPVTRLEAGK